ncbi:hypothetical protein DFH08DRAFT_368668 [Mycena albidolilacea]|uniref:Uncharacterized protein n=1 Tax=Mycena albidolilacea TaxID=1033008 RepID=A0AAD7F182_9AGAR|nr:hypothetical protein DFH08DRAFT_368668 [Mycena albidolilacea]
MRKSTGGRAPRRIDPTLLLEPCPSHSDPAVPLVSVHTPGMIRPPEDDDDDPVPATPRPRPSLQIYYTAPDAADPAVLDAVARTLETDVLFSRSNNSEFYDRLDVYGLPSARDEVVARCIAHQRGEIAARAGSNSKEWYIQRYDTGGQWVRALIVLERPLAEWQQPDSEGKVPGLSVVMFEPVPVVANVVDPDASASTDSFRVRPAETAEEGEVLVCDLRHELNWQHSSGQFKD